jgi:hypothetical protein
MLADVPDLAISASLAASVVVLRPAGALILLPALAVAAAAFKLLLVAKVIMMNCSDQFFNSLLYVLMMSMVRINI